MGFARKSEPTASLSAIDGDPTWQAIYSRLAATLGDKVAYSWFAQCRFINRTETTLSIAHWNGFSADHCIQHHGSLLASLARVPEVRIYREGGYRPVNLDGQGRKSQGFAQYRVGKLKAPSFHNPAQAGV